MVEKRLALEQNSLRVAERKVEKELIDVIELQKTSIRYLFLLSLRNYEEQLKKENQEYLKAALNFNEAIKVIELLKFELKLLQDKIANEAIVKEELETKLLAIEEQILSEHSSYLAEYKSYTVELQTFFQWRVEIEEAVNMLKILKESFDALIHYLKKAEEYDDWGEFYAEKQLAKIRKKAFIDRADAEVMRLEKTLVLLKEELTDVVELKELFKRTEILIRGFNFKYYDSLIFDWVENLNLKGTISMKLNRSKSLDDLKIGLDKLKDAADQEYRLHTLKRELLVNKIIG